MRAPISAAKRSKDATEYELEDRIVEFVKSAPALVLATFSALDVDRLVTLYKATQKAGRVFVADAYTAFVMYLVGNKAKVPKPSRENGIRVFYNHLFERRQIEKIRNLFLDRQDRVGRDPRRAAEVCNGVPSLDG